MLKHASFPAAEIRTATIVPWKRKSFFARVLDALHHSRRIQARRIVRQYRDVIAHGGRPPSGDRSDLDH